MRQRQQRVNERDQHLARAKAGVRYALAQYVVGTAASNQATFSALIDAIASVIEAVELSEIDTMKIAILRVQKEPV